MSKKPQQPEDEVKAAPPQEALVLGKFSRGVLRAEMILSAAGGVMLAASLGGKYLVNRQTDFLNKQSDGIELTKQPYFSGPLSGALAVGGAALSLASALPKWRVAGENKTLAQNGELAGNNKQHDLALTKLDGGLKSVAAGVGLATVVSTAAKAPHLAPAVRGTMIGVGVASAGLNLAVQGIKLKAAKAVEAHAANPKKEEEAPLSHVERLERSRAEEKARGDKGAERG